MPRLHLCYKSPVSSGYFFQEIHSKLWKSLVFALFTRKQNNYAAKASLIITQQPKSTAAESRNFRWATNSYYFLDNNFHDDCMALSSPLVHNVQCRSTCLRYTQNEHVHAVHAVAATNTQCKGPARGAAGMAMGDGQVCAQSCAEHQFFISVWAALSAA